MALFARDQFIDMFNNRLLSTTDSDIIKSDLTNGPGNMKTLVFPHITKTGGVSLIAYLIASFKIERIFPVPPQLTLSTDELSALSGKTQEYDFVHCHPCTSLAEYYPLDNAAWITIFRDPVRRIVSEYLYAAANEENQNHLLAKKVDIVDFANVIGHWQGNFQTRQLAVAFGLLPDPFSDMTNEIASRVFALAHEMSFLMTTERLGESLKLFSNHMALPWFGTVHENATKTDSETINTLMLTILQSDWYGRNEWDYRLYRLANDFLDAETAAQRQCELIASVKQGRGINCFAASTTANGAFCLLDEGWEQQGWEADPPSSATAYWWGRSQASLLIFSAEVCTVRLRFRLVSTVGFDPKEGITYWIGGRQITPQYTTVGSNLYVELEIGGQEFSVTKERMVKLAIHGLYCRAFAVIDPSHSDCREKSFAIGDISLDQGVKG